MLLGREHGWLVEYAPLLILVGVVFVYYALMTALILCMRRIRRTKRTPLVITPRQRLLILLNRWQVLERIDVMQTVLSLVLCSLYVVETYGIDGNWFSMLERIVNAFFGVDYIFQFYISRNKLEFLYSLMAFVDVVTLAPFLVFNQVFSIDHDTSVVLRVVRITKLFRILRSFRFLRNRPEDVSREVAMLAFGLFCLIFTAAGFYQLVENDMKVLPEQASSVPFHEAFYFTTIEILGRPRIEPESPGGHLLLILVVTVAFIIIPWQAASILKALQRDPWARRTRYKRMSDAHIVIMGHIEFPVLNLLLYEAYHPDRGPARPCDIVILSPNEADHQVLDLLGHPAYTGHVQYIQGSSQVEKDLFRAKVHEAMAVLVLACKYPQDPQWEDTQVASIVLACKAFKNAQLHRQKTFEGRRRLRLLAQVLSAETRDRIVNMPGWDRLHDLCLVIGELTAAMVAGSALHRGLSTMVLNLVSHTTSHAYDTNTEQWFDLYHKGSRQEIYHCSITSKSGIHGLNLVEAAYHLYENHGILLIAVKRQSRGGAETPGSTFSKHRKHRLLLFPSGQDTILQDGDRVYVIAGSLPEAVVAIKRGRSPERPMLRPSAAGRSSKGEDSRETGQAATLVRKGDGEQHTWEEDSNPDFLSRLKARSEHWTMSGGLSTRLRSYWWKLRWPGEFYDAKDEQAGIGSFDLDSSPVKLHNMKLSKGFNFRELERIQSEETSAAASRTEEKFERVLSLHSQSFGRVASWPSERSFSPPVQHQRTNTKAMDIQALRLQRLASLLLDYGGDLRELEKDLASLGVRREFQPQSLGEPQEHMTKMLSSSFKDMGLQSAADYLNEIRGHIVIFGGDEKSIALTVQMLLVRDPVTEIVVLSMASHEERSPEIWQHISLDTVYFAKELVHNQRDLRGAHLERAKAVVILPKIDKDVAKAPVQGWELRRMVDSDTILTTNIIATRKFIPGDELRDVWTVTQMFQEGSLNRFFGMNPEAQGATSLFEDRWMASAPLNMSPLFAAGHIIATTTVDRFLMESFFNPDAMIIVERLFGLAGLTVGSKVHHGLGSPSLANQPCVFQMPATAKMISSCRSFGEAANMLISHSQPMLPLGIFRYPNGHRSSYSMLVSLEAAQELDFRSPYYGVSQSFVGDDQGDQMSNRLPFVITNPPKDLVLLPTDMLFVLGRPLPDEAVPSDQLGRDEVIMPIASEDEGEEVVSSL
ncbi:slo [Symbiodinium necroappetens]|uniref:Slo protein n=1 Tax=Symbiodinium necroappetens TaxID=1628268 RepID=A0A812ZVY7_9DINO|nr:slo [Symbiodinium necroappetens]